MVKCSQLCS